MITSFTSSQVSSSSGGEGVISLWDTGHPDCPMAVLQVDQPCSNMAFSNSGWLAAISFNSTVIFVSENYEASDYFVLL